MFGFLGPNGAGKTTTISMLCTLVRPTGGTARVAGHDIVTERDEVPPQHRPGVPGPHLDANLTAVQNLRFHGELYGLPSGAMTERIGQVLDMVDLTERKDSKVETFSGGMKRRLEIARGLLHSPRVLFLDEPTVGLDPQTRNAIWGYINQLRDTEDITIFLTTHYMEEAEYCDRIAIIDHGEIVVLDTPESLRPASARTGSRSTPATRGGDRGVETPLRP